MARTASCCLLALLIAVPVGGSAAVALEAPPAARECGHMTATVSRSGADSELLVTLPDGVSGPAADAFQVRQGSTDVNVTGVADVATTDLDVVVVVDTAGGPEDVVAAGLNAAETLLTTLPSAVAAGVVSTTGGVEQKVVTDPSAAARVVAGLDQTGGDRQLYDALLRGIGLMRPMPHRQQQVVLITTGPDTGSSATWNLVGTRLFSRGITLEVIDLSAPEQPALPGGAAGCPGRVSVDQAQAAAAETADRITGGVRLTVPVLDLTQPITLEYSDGSGLVAAPVARRGFAIDDSRPAADDGGGGVGLGTLALAFLIGLVPLIGLFFVILTLSGSGGRARRALVEAVRAYRGVHTARARAAEAYPGELHQATRRWGDAVQDLQSLVTSAPTARALAQAAALEEDLYRTERVAREVAAMEREAARDRAAARTARTLRHAERVAAEQRALRAVLDLEELVAQTRGRHSAPVTGQRSEAVVEAARVVAEHRAAVEAAVHRRLAAERAAEEAIALARDQQEAAEAAEAARVAAERAALEAAQEAEQERLSAGAASAARRRAESAASRAARKAEEDSRAAAEATERRRAAELASAEAEETRLAAVEREEAARRSAEEAETARKQAVEQLASQRAKAEQEARETLARAEEERVLADQQARESAEARDREMVAARLREEEAHREQWDREAKRRQEQWDREEQVRREQWDREEKLRREQWAQEESDRREQWEQEEQQRREQWEQTEREVAARLDAAEKERRDAWAREEELLHAERERLEGERLAQREREDQEALARLEQEERRHRARWEEAETEVKQRLEREELARRAEWATEEQQRLQRRESEDRQRTLDWDREEQERRERWEAEESARAAREEEERQRREEHERAVRREREQAEKKRRDAERRERRQREAAQRREREEREAAQQREREEREAAQRREREAQEAAELEERQAAEQREAQEAAELEERQAAEEREAQEAAELEERQAAEEREAQEAAELEERQAAEEREAAEKREQEEQEKRKKEKQKRPAREAARAADAPVEIDLRSASRIRAVPGTTGATPSEVAAPAAQAAPAPVRESTVDVPTAVPGGPELPDSIVDDDGPGARVPAAVALRETPPRRLHVVVDDDDEDDVSDPGEVPVRARGRRLTDEEWRTTSVPRPVQPPAAPRPDPETRPVREPAAWVAPSTTVAGWASRVLAVLAVPAAVAAKTASVPRWWDELATPSLAALGLAALSTVIGLLWLWQTTHPPYALRRRDARRILRAMHRRAAQEEAADVLLAALRAGSATGQVWTTFEIDSGLTVLPPTRAAIDPDMHAAGLVRYLVARQHVALPHPVSLFVAAAVPAVVFLLPALALIALV